MQCLSAKQIKRFLKAAEGDEYFALFVLAVTTGARIGEILGLAWSDVDVRRGQLTIQRAAKEVGGHLFVEDTKTPRSRRTIKLTPQAVEALKDVRKKAKAGDRLDRPVFCDTAGGYMRRSNIIARHFYPIRKIAKIPQIRFHDLRHSAATLMLSSGVPVPTVSAVLGHANPATTLAIYSHVLPGHQDGAAAAVANALS